MKLTKALTALTTTASLINQQHSLSQHVHIHSPDSHITDRNLRENVHRGDHIGIGLDDNTLRAYSQNIRGAKVFNKWDTWESGFNTLKEWCVGLTCLQETNIPWLHKHRSSALAKIRKINKKSVFTCSSSSEIESNEYQPGGTASALLGKWAGRYLRPIEDTELGRFSGFTLRCKGDRCLHVINVYRPCKDSIERTGDITAWKQQWTILRRQGHDSPDPRETCLNDIETLVHNLSDTTDDDILLFCDANESLFHRNSRLQQFIANCNLFNLHSAIATPPATYSRGSQCIDYIFGTHRVRNAVRGCGFFPFFEGAWNSDHRALYVDFDAEILFGENTEQLPTTAERHIRSTVRELVDKYISYIPTGKIYELTSRIENLAKKDKWATTDRKEFDHIDNELTKTLLKAEKRCKKAGYHPWTDEIDEAYKIYSFWKIKVSSAKTGLDASNKLSDIANSVLPDVLCMGDRTKSDSQQLRRATKQLFRKRQEAYETRPTKLHFHYEKLVLEGKLTKAKAVKLIEKHERRQRVFRAFKSVLAPKSSGGISHVLIQEVKGNYVRIQNKNDLDKVLYDRNTTHFAQAEGTPCTVDPLKTLLGHSGISDLGDQILRGELPDEISDNLHEAAVWLLTELKQVRDALPDTITFEEFLAGFRKWKESTTTSPSGLHLGHYKSLIAAFDWYEKTKPKESTEPCLAELVLRIKWNIVNLAISHTHTLARWKTIHNFFLEKIPGFPLLEKLRVIHLYEADWNFLLRHFIAYKLTRTAVCENTVAPEQGGGRPGRAAIDLATKTIVSTETCRIQRKTAVRMYNDAKACYDRVIESLANLCLLREGLNPKIAKLHSQTFEQVDYLIKTQLGISEISNGHNRPAPFHGRGQGAADAPSTWGFISDNLIRAFNKRTHQSYLVGPVSRISQKEGINIFVDDSNLLVIAVDDQQHHVEKLMAHNLQIWESLLFASGGKLELSKCKFTVLRWHFDRHGRPKMWVPPSPTEHVMTLTSSNTQKPETIRYLRPKDSYKLLGVQMALDGNSHQQLKDLEEKLTKLTIAFRQCPLASQDTRQGYESIYLPSVRYALAATNIPWSSLERIQGKIKDAVLPKLGFNRNIPNAIAYAPLTLGGIDLKHLSVEQAIEHIMIILSHIRSDSELGTALRILLESFQVASGYTGNPLKNLSAAPHVDSPWLDIARGFLHLINGFIDLPGLSQVSLQRINDVALMELAVARYSGKPLEDINNCRMYLQVFTLSDIVSDDGTRILETAYNGLPNPDGTPKLWSVSTSTIQWPYQPRPGPAPWKVWQEFLDTFCSHTRYLKTPLRHWIPTDSGFLRRWKYMQTPRSLWERTDRYWREWVCHSSSRHSCTYIATSNIQINLPTGAVPATPLARGNTLQSTNFPHEQTQPSDDSSPSESLKQYIANTRPWLLPLIPKIEQLTINAVEELHAAKTLHTASDGGADYEQLTFGWVIASEKTILWEGLGVVPPALRYSSLRAEAYGRLVVDEVCRAIHEYYHIVPPNRQHKGWIDNSSVIKRIIDLRRHAPYASQTLRPEYEALSQSACTSKHHLHYTLHHVKGHQVGDDLPWEAQLNQRCDELATAAKTLITPTCPIQFPHRTATLFINSTEVPADVKEAMREAYHGQDMRDYLVKKYKWKAITPDLVDWHVHGASLKRLRGRCQTTILKFIHNWLPVNASKTTTHMQRSKKCPQCKECDETQNHFLECNDRVIQDAWQLTAKDLQKKLMTTATDPILRKLIVLAFSSWRTTAHPVRPEWLPTRYDKLFSEQSQIGWHQILHGRISLEFVRLHDDYSKTIKTTKNGVQLMSTALACIFEQIYAVWKCRNAAQHGVDQISRREAMLRKYVPRVHQIFNNLGNIDLEDRRAFNKTLTEVLALSPRLLERWVHTHSKLMDEALARARTRTKLQTPALTNYYKPVPPTQPPTQHSKRRKPQTPTQTKNIIQTQLPPQWREKLTAVVKKVTSKQFPRLSVNRTITEFFHVPPITRPTHSSHHNTADPSSFQPP